MRNQYTKANKAQPVGKGDVVATELLLLLSQSLLCMCRRVVVSAVMAFMVRSSDSKLVPIKLSELGLRVRYVSWRVSRRALR